MEEIIENIDQTVETVEMVETEVISPVETIEVVAAAEPVKPIAQVDPVELAVKKPHKRILQGKVVSNKPDKTIVVKVERQVAHPLYKKYYKVSKKFMAHDENNECKTGDTVRIRESRPLSALKRWTLLDVVERAK